MGITPSIGRPEEKGADRGIIYIYDRLLYMVAHFVGAWSALKGLRIRSYHTHTRTHARTHAPPTNTHTRTHTHARTHARTPHKHTHTHAHARTHARRKRSKIFHERTRKRSFICICFKGNVRGTSERQGVAPMGFPERFDTILN